MCAVFFSHHLGRRGCVPERFRYNGQKGPVVDYRLRALYRVYHLSAVRIPQRQKIWTDVLANAGQIMCWTFFEFPREWQLSVGGRSFPPSRLCHNLKRRLNSTRHAGLDPASRNVRPWNSTGFRVKPGMTIQQQIQFYQLRHSLEGGNPVDFSLNYLTNNKIPLLHSLRLTFADNFNIQTLTKSTKWSHRLVV